jgi:hypothetical protein
MQRDMTFEQHKKHLAQCAKATRMTADALAIVNGEVCGEPVKAQVNTGEAKFLLSETEVVTLHDILIGLCECKGAMIVTPQDPRFYCFVCRNVSNDGKPRPVDFSEVNDG